MKSFVLCGFSLVGPKGGVEEMRQFFAKKRVFIIVGPFLTAKRMQDFEKKKIIIIKLVAIT